MPDLRIQPLTILHYGKEVLANDTEIANANNPLVVISDAVGYDHKHLQVRILPFDEAYVANETLAFTAKVQYMPKTLRKLNVFEGDSASIFQTIPKDEIVADLITDFFTAEDGFDDEFAEFLNGWNTKPVTGYENNLTGFFTNHYLGLSQTESDQFNLGMAG